MILLIKGRHLWPERVNSKVTRCDIFGWSNYISGSCFTQRYHILLSSTTYTGTHCSIILSYTGFKINGCPVVKNNQNLTLMTKSQKMAAHWTTIFQATNLLENWYSHLSNHNLSSKYLQEKRYNYTISPFVIEWFLHNAPNAHILCHLVLHITTYQ